VTLPEMLVVLAIAGMFLLIAIPAGVNYVRSARIRTAADVFVKDLQASRYVAVTTRQSRTFSLGSTPPATFYQFTDVKGNTQVVTLPDGVTVDTATNFPVTFTLLGALQGPPATATVTGRLTPTRSHVYTVTVGATGKVTYTFDRNAP
jgi:prepilin-type N-terminal cleavage/methylation domain-containing protein